MISIQIIDKSSGINKLHRTIGRSNDPREIERLIKEGKNEIDLITGLQSIPFGKEK